MPNCAPDPRPIPSRAVPGAVRSVVAAYQRRALWLEAADLQAEAAVVSIEASRTWRPGGAPLASYQARAVAKHLGRYLAKQRCPASGKDPIGISVEIDDSARTDTPDAEWHIDLERACAEVRRILAGKSAAARAVLLGERAPAEVAAELGVPARRLYVEIKAATRALRRSRVLAELVEGL